MTSPIDFLPIQNVATCEPYDFAFSYNITDFVFNLPSTVNTLQAWVDPLNLEIQPIIRHELAVNLTLNSSVTSVTWNPVNGVPGPFSLNALIKSSSGASYQPILVEFEVKAGNDTSCLPTANSGIGSNGVSISNVAPSAMSTVTANATGSSTSHKLSSGAVTGIVIGIILLYFTCVTIFVMIRRRNRARKEREALPTYIFATGIEGGGRHDEDVIGKEMETAVHWETATVRSEPPPYGERKMQQD
ncbi:hypothetical protein BD410DRAFT_277514 [Rickenella mellea]|uniref:Uncharacterized protein n=1 Tax=Rickenella mellea TaxID=50990 RepID=A0A4Y7Q5H3_9AGAM|nr:hypothetical protein BD410DRAFT_277514 [Rickenella mellea]